MKTVDVGSLLDEGQWSPYQKLLVAGTALTIILDGLDNQVLGAAVPALDFFIGLVILPLDTMLQGLRQTFGHVFAKVLLVVLDRQRVVAAAVNDLCGDGFLATHGVDRHQGAVQIQHLEQLGNSGDLVRLGVDGYVPETEMVLAGPSTD